MYLYRQTTESTRNEQYVDDRLEPLARRYEVEALRKAMESSVDALRSVMAGSGERLKFELLHGETAQVRRLASRPIAAHSCV